MEFNEYSMELHVKRILAEARAAAAEEARGRSASRTVMPAVRHALDRVRQRYVRWSSAASTGSKPITARAWSRSR